MNNHWTTNPIVLLAACIGPCFARAEWTNVTHDEKKSWGIYRTEDGGGTWTKVSELGCSGRALVASDGTNAKSRSLYAWRSSEKKVPDAILRWDLP